MTTTLPSSLLHPPDHLILAMPYSDASSDSGRSNSNSSIDPMDLIVIRKRSRSPSLAPSSSFNALDADVDTMDLDLDLDPEGELADIKAEEACGSGHSRAQSPASARKPMRKRAKTQEEKDVRAQERIMRNRLAAQTSRQRKREYVSTMEAENGGLKRKLGALAKENKTLKGEMSLLNKRLESMEQLLRFVTGPAPSSLFDAEEAPEAPVETMLDYSPLDQHLLSPDNLLRHLTQQDRPSGPSLQSSPNAPPFIKPEPDLAAPTPALAAATEAATVSLSPSSFEPRIPAVNVDQQRHSKTMAETWTRSNPSSTLRKTQTPSSRMSSSSRMQPLPRYSPTFYRLAMQVLQQAAQVATLQKTCRQRSLLLFSKTRMPTTPPLSQVTSSSPRTTPVSTPSSTQLLPSLSNAQRACLLSHPPGARISFMNHLAATEGTVKASMPLRPFGQVDQHARWREALMAWGRGVQMAAVVMVFWAREQQQQLQQGEKSAGTGLAEQQAREENAAAVRARQADPSK